MKRRSLYLSLLAGALCVLLSACAAAGSSSTPTPVRLTPAATKIATATPTATPSPTPKKTPSPTPTPSPTQRPTSTFTPVPTPFPESVRGLRIAYIREENLCLYNGDAQESSSFSTEGNVTFYNLLFSPDGSKLLYEYYPPPGDAEQAYNVELHILDLATQHTTVLLRHTQLGEDSIWWHASWTPDGKAVAFNTVANPLGYPAPLHDDLWTVDVASGELTQVLQTGEGGDFTFSPDGSHVIVSTPRDLSMLRSDGSDRRTLVEFHPVGTGSEGEYRPMASWAADSSHARVAIPWVEEDYDQADYALLWELPLSGPATRGITITWDFSMMQEESLWSPDISVMAYRHQTDEKGAPYQYAQIIAGADGTDPKVYATDGVTFRAWSPDSQHFICTAYENGTEIYLCAVEQSPTLLRTLPQDTRLLDVRWIDPQRLLCVFLGPSGVSVEILHIDGTTTPLDILGDAVGPELDVFVFAER